jgi:histidinol-phosphate phosphatase family protein
VSYDIVIPSAGRESLGRLLRALAAGIGPAPQRVVVVDDRPVGAEPLQLPSLPLPVKLLRGRGRGPAAARNVGWRASSAEWVAFLDDDVLAPRTWREALSDDIDPLPPGVVASQGRIVVPLPRERRPTDWERNVAALEHARWATADMAYRRSALEAVGGFDERFSRAYREDADLGLRVTAAGGSIARGRRHVLHPVRPAPAGISMRLQAGNADDVLMDAVHGQGWRSRAGAPQGRLRRHVAVTGAALVAGSSLLVRRPRVTASGAALWLAGTAELAWARIAPGPRTANEVWRMLWTSALLPPAAVFHRLRGHLRVQRARRVARPAAVLLDRDGTLVEDVPYNGDPELVRPRPGAFEALARLRAAGVRMAVVSNQSGIGRGLLIPDEVDAVNRRVEELLGPIGPWFVCPHDAAAGCECRKPRPGLVLRAAERLGVEPRACALIGDIGSDVEAALAAGARGVLVPTPRTLQHEVDAAPETASTLPEAVERLLA